MKQIFVALCCACLVCQLYAVDRQTDEKLIKAIAKRQACMAFIGSASGVVIDAKGLVLTNYHVIFDEKTRHLTKDWRIRIDKRLVPATVIGVDPVGDLALLQCQAPGPFAAAPFPDHNQITIGATVFALGNPFGSSGIIGDPSASSGIISAKHRYVYTENDPYFPDICYADALQTDTAINPGNSGGPLFNIKGELIGINGQIRTRFGARANSGIGFAIGIGQIKAFLPLLKTAKGGSVYHGLVRGLHFDPDSARDSQGLLVQAVDRDSTAAKAGIQAKDRITAVDGHPIHGPDSWHSATFSKPSQTSIRISLRRQGKDLVQRVTLDAWRPPNLGLGMELDAPERHLFDLNIPELASDSPAYKAGLRQGDRILTFNKRRIDHRHHLNAYLRSRNFVAGDKVDLTILRNRKMQSFTIPLQDKYPAGTE